MVASGASTVRYTPPREKPKRDPFLPWQGWAILIGFASAMVGVFILGHVRSDSLRARSEECERQDRILVRDAADRFVCARYTPCP